MEYLPQGRYDNQAGYELNPHGKGPFCQFQLPTLSESAGAYAIVVGEEVVYIGECQNFSERYGPRGYGVIHPRNCYVGGQSTNCKINAARRHSSLGYLTPNEFEDLELNETQALLA